MYTTNVLFSAVLKTTYKNVIFLCLKKENNNNDTDKQHNKKQQQQSKQTNNDKEKKQTNTKTKGTQMDSNLQSLHFKAGYPLHYTGTFQLLG